MLDVFNIPGQQDNVKIFYTKKSATFPFTSSDAWQTWHKPRGANFVWMMCVGSGGGGTMGGTPAPSNAFGGGGAGSGAITRALFPANVLPDVLYVYVGPGGVGGVNGINSGFGANGQISWVSISTITSSAMNVVCASGASPATGQNGTAETPVTTTIAGLLSLGNWISVAGQAGAGGTGGSTVTPFNATTLTCGGGHGGDTTAGAIPTVRAGDTIVQQSSLNTPQIAGGAGSTIGDGENGGDGFFTLKPFFYSLGGGGGGSASVSGANGGRGGNAGIGSGGGGGGASLSGSTSQGGRGGDGLVIIAAF